MKDWTKELEQLEAFFSKAEIKYSVVLPDGAEIANIHKFANTHINCCRRNNGKKTFLPYLERLRMAKKIIE